MSENKSPMQIALGGVISVVIIIGGIGAMLALGSRKEDVGRPPQQAEIPTVQTIGVLPHDGGLDLEVDGVVTPYREIEVSAEVAGIVETKELSCRAGTYVTKGQPLIVIDRREYQLNVDAAAKRYEQAGAELNEVAVEITNATELEKLAQKELMLQQNELNRLQRLRDGNIVTASDIDQAQRAVVIAENALQTVTNRLRLLRTQKERLQIAQEVAKSQWEMADLDLSRSNVVAPCDGVIVRDVIEQGAYVQKGTPLFVIEDTSKTEIKTNLQVDELYWLWQQSGNSQLVTGRRSQAAAYQIPKLSVSVFYQFAGRPELRFKWDGVLDRYDGIGFDEKTRTVPCRIVVSDPRAVTFAPKTNAPSRPLVNEPPALVRGMYVTVHIHTEQRSAFVRVPEIAVQPGKVVWRVRDGRLERIGPLPTAKVIDGVPLPGTEETRYWLVPTAESGLSAGDRLVRLGMAGASEGQPVKEERVDSGGAVAGL